MGGGGGGRGEGRSGRAQGRVVDTPPWRLPASARVGVERRRVAPVGCTTGGVAVTGTAAAAGGGRRGPPCDRRGGRVAAAPAAEAEWPRPPRRWPSGHCRRGGVAGGRGGAVEAPWAHASVRRPRARPCAAPHGPRRSPLLLHCSLLSRRRRRQVAVHRGAPPRCPLPGATVRPPTAQAHTAAVGTRRPPSVAPSRLAGARRLRHPASSRSHFISRLKNVSWGRGLYLYCLYCCLSSFGRRGRYQEESSTV